MTTEIFVGILFMLGVAFSGYELLVVAPLRKSLRSLTAKVRSDGENVRQATALAVQIVGTARRQGSQVSALVDRVGQLELNTPSRPYQEAISRAVDGADADSISDTFGLTLGEAKLVRLLHGGETPPS